MDMIIWIILAVALVVAAWFILTYNSLVSVRNRAEEAWSDIDVQLKRRYDLVPNVVEAVRGYAKHEEGVFRKVTEARSQAMQAKTPAEHAKAENMLTDTLKSLFAVAEAYPSLQAAGSFIHLQQELSELESHIQSARRFYNGNVREYNTKLQTFPTNTIAGMFGFTPREFFEGGEGIEAAPQVKF